MIFENIRGKMFRYSYMNWLVYIVRYQRGYRLSGLDNLGASNNTTGKESGTRGSAWKC